MLSSVETIAEFVQVLLKMFFTQTMICTNNKSSKVADEHVHMREYDVRFALSDYMRVVPESMLFERRIYPQTISTNCTSWFNNCFGKLRDGCRIDLCYGFQSCKFNILFVPFTLEERYRNKTRVWSVPRPRFRPSAGAPMNNSSISTDSES